MNKIKISWCILTEKDPFCYMNSREIDDMLYAGYKCSEYLKERIYTTGDNPDIICTYHFKCPNKMIEFLFVHGDCIYNE